MLDVYGTSTNSYTQAQGTAVATLMYAAGIAVNMAYGTSVGTSGSGAVSADISDALIDYFNYRPGTGYYHREYYTQDQWEQMLYENLRDYGPVIYGGHGTGGGHSFICDGYRTNGYFHFNWGWGGSSDGYFLTSALEPGSQGIGGSSNGSGFTITQDAVLGMAPNDGSHPAGTRQGFMMGTTLGTASLSKSGSSHTVTFSYSNDYSDWRKGINNTTGQSVITGVIIEDADGNVVATDAGSNQATNINRGYVYALPTSVSISQSLQAGTYRVYMGFKEGNGEWQKMAVPLSGPQYYTLTVSGKNWTLSLPEESKLSVTDFGTDGTLYTNSLARFHFTIANSGDTDASEDVRLGFTNTSSSYSLYQLGPLVHVDVPAHSSVVVSDYDVTLNSEITAGTWYAMVATDEMTVITDELTVVTEDHYPFTVVELPATRCTVTGFQLLGSSTGRERDDLTFQYTITVSQGVYKSPISIYIVPASQSGISLSDYEVECPAAMLDATSAQSQAPAQPRANAAAAAGPVSQTYTVRCAYADGEDGQTYKAALVGMSTDHTSLTILSNTYPTFTLGVHTGVDDLQAQPEAAPEVVARFAPDGRAVTPAYRGLVIERLSDGTSRKILAK